MNMTGNTLLITGGGSGIGRGLAEAFHALGNKVVIAGRRRQVLEETVAANPGMEFLALDVESAGGIGKFAAQIAEKYPDLNGLINNAGIMRPENLLAAQETLADSEAMVTTNLLGPIRLTTALLPHLLKQKNPVVMNVSSGLAFVPLALTPTYCATKAAIHSYTLSLRYQLKSTPAQILELVPPYVATDLMGGKADPRAMPLREFLDEVMEILKTKPDAKEICVKRVAPLRYAAEGGKFDEFFENFNDAMKDVH